MVFTLVMDGDLFSKSDLVEGKEFLLPAFRAEDRVIVWELEQKEISQKGIENNAGLPDG